MLFAHANETPNGDHYEIAPSCDDIRCIRFLVNAGTQASANFTITKAQQDLVRLAGLIANIATQKGKKNIMASHVPSVRKRLEKSVAKVTQDIKKQEKIISAAEVDPLNKVKDKQEEQKAQASIEKDENVAAAGETEEKIVAPGNPLDALQGKEGTGSGTGKPDPIENRPGHPRQKNLSQTIRRSSKRRNRGKCRRDGGRG